MSSIVAMRSAIVDTLTPQLKSAGVRTCRAYHGPLDIAELKQAFHAAPAVLIVCLGIAEVRPESTLPVAVMRWAGFVLTEGATPQVREDAALLIVGSLSSMVPHNRWGLTGAHRPERVRGRSLYSGQLDEQAVALWSVDWSQALDLDPAVAAEDLKDFITLHTTYEVGKTANTADPTDQVTLEQDP